MEPNVVDGYRWAEERLEFLRALLSGDFPDGDREVVEAEIAALAKTQPLGCTGPSSRPAWLRTFSRRTSASASDEDPSSTSEPNPDSSPSA